MRDESKREICSAAVLEIGTLTVEVNAPCLHNPTPSCDLQQQYSYSHSQPQATCVNLQSPAPICGCSPRRFAGVHAVRAWHGKPADPTAGGGGEASDGSSSMIEGWIVTLEASSSHSSGGRFSCSLATAIPAPGLIVRNSDLISARKKGFSWFYKHFVMVTGGRLLQIILLRR